MSVHVIGIDPQDDRCCNDPLASMKKSISAAIASLTAEPTKRQPSHTVVLEAAAYLLGKGLLTIKQLQQTNVKQGRALLIWASWLQYQKSCDWVAEGKISRDGMLHTPTLLRQLEMILMGAAGSGKTTTVMVQEALLDFFCGDGSMKKSAPTITAARLLGGNTVHALYKLPLGTLHGKRGKLSDAVLKPFRKKWASTRAHVIDEMSMLLPNNFYQLEVRSRTAMRDATKRFGGLATLLGGDFLQLPPVDGQWKSLAVPWEQVERLRQEIEEETNRKVGPQAKQEKKAVNKKDELMAQVREAEHRGGCELWRSLQVVVSLTLNMRSGGVLARILQEMREGGLSDAMWQVLQDRVIGVTRSTDGSLCQVAAGMQDARLNQPPFSTNHIQYIVHRHVIRAAQAYVNALREAVELRQRLYIITAADAVAAGKEDQFGVKEQKEALNIVNLRRTKFLPGQLPLYVGMRVLLFGKACVELSLMNGCECVVEEIILADEEPEFEEVAVGKPTQLEYMPAGLVLRAADADWILPSHLLPALPASFDRRGIFILAPATDYFSMTTSSDSPLEIRRVQFPVVPASARIVYNSQGESFHASVADLARPPSMSVAVHWLACYVMLSRARSIEGLLILRLATREQLSTGAPAYLVEAIDRLLMLERTSAAMMRAHLAQCEGLLPPDVLHLFDDEAVDDEAAAFATFAQKGSVASTAKNSSNFSPAAVAQGMDEQGLQRDLVSVASCVQDTLAHGRFGIAQQSVATVGPRRLSPSVQQQVEPTQDFEPCSGEMVEKEVDEQENMSDMSMLSCVHDPPSSYSPASASMNGHAAQCDLTSASPCVHGPPVYGRTDIAEANAATDGLQPLARSEGDISMDLGPCSGVMLEKERGRTGKHV